MSEKVQKIAVDVGSGFTQFTDGANNGSLPSIVTPMPETLGFGANQAKDVITINGQTYLVGQDAYSYGDPDTREDTLSEDWAGSIGWQALFFSSVAKLVSDPSANLKVVTGLPQRLFAPKKDGLAQFLNNTHSFGVNGKQYKIKITGKVIPQAASALFVEARKNKDILQDAVGIIDIGTYTTGFSVMENGAYISHKSNGCSVGMSQLIKAFKTWLMREKGFSIDEAKIPKILMEKKFRFRGEMFEAAKEIDQLAITVAQPMLDTINANWKGAGDLIVYVAGGGAPYFMTAVKTIIPHAQVMDDAFFAVVKGMHCYLENVA